MTETDHQLLSRYAGQNAEDAFAAVVRRHLDLVFSAALRQVRSPQLAEEVAQSVFSDLARRAPDLAPDTVLPAWLYQVTRRSAIDVVRRESRRQLREQIACEMNVMNAPAADWSRVEPLLDEAMETLDNADRTAILLRYFENQSLREVGQALGTSDDAAQKRVSRALERLRKFLAKNGVTVGAGGLAAIVSANAVQASPAGLALTIATAATGGFALTTSTLIATTKTIAMTTLQKTLVTAIIAAAAVGSGLYEAHHAAQLQNQIERLQQQQGSLADQLRQAQGEQMNSSNQMADLLAENARLKAGPNSMELLKLRGKVTQLQSAANDPAATAAEAWMAKVNTLKQRLEVTPAAKIPEMQLLTEQDWLDATKNNNLATDNDFRRAFSSLRQEAENQFVQTSLKPALNSYLQANNGQFPTDLSQLQSYFNAPVDPAILQRWEVTPGSTVPTLGLGEQIITETAAVDDLLDSRIAIGSDGATGSTSFLASETQPTLQPVYQAYIAANGAIGATAANFNFSQLMSYATTPAQQAAVQKLIQQQALSH
jgi:RNA polymerase sigma factor (sigma-70 family)